MVAPQRMTPIDDNGHPIEAAVNRRIRTLGCADRENHHTIKEIDLDSDLG
jgi:hypothetical protein